MTENNILAQNDLSHIVQKVADAENIQSFEISEVKNNKKGEGFLGEISMVTVLDKNSNRQLDILIKKAFSIDEVRAKAPIRKTFENEIHFYTTLYPTIEAFREKNGCKIKYDLVAKCFASCLDDKLEWLVFDNLKSKSFEVISKKKLLDADHMALIFQRYGYFHALSFALKQNNPDKFAKITNQIHLTCGDFFDSDFFQKSSVALFKDVHEVIVVGENDELQKAFEKYLENPVAIVRPWLGVNDEYSVLLHGDCWSNNMLFKYDKQTGKPVDMRIIDWQLINVGNPVCDLSYALYSGASKSVFDNLNKYLKIYHDSFSLTLKQFGLDADQLYPFSVLKQHWKLFSRFGLLWAIHIMRMKLTNDEDILDLNDYVELDDSLKIKFNRDEYYGRITDLLRHFHAYGSL